MSRHHTLEEGKRPPTPTLSALVRKQPVLLRADFVLSKDPWLLYYKTPLLVFFAAKSPFVGPVRSLVRTKSALSKNGYGLISY